MKKAKRINYMIARKIIKENPPEYIVWADNTQISLHDLIHEFFLVYYEDGSANLHCIMEDYIIENINS